MMYPEWTEEEVQIIDDLEGEIEIIIIDFIEGEILTKMRISKIRDTIKTVYCENNNIKLLRIPYWEFDNIESILKEKLLIK